MGTRSIHDRPNIERVRLLSVIVVGTLTAVSLAACSSSGGGSSTNTSGSSSAAASTPAAVNESSIEAASVTAGRAAATKAGAQVALPQETVGNILFQGSDETTQRTANAIKAGAAALGWKYISCDGQGTPTKWASCASTLMNQGAKVLISAGIDPSVLTASLGAAKTRGVEFFNTEAVVPPAQSSLYAGNYGPGETDASDTLAAYIISKLDTLPASQRTIDLITYDAVYGLKLRTDELVAKLTAAGIKVTARHTLDFANVTTDVTAITNSWLTANPKLGAIFSVADAPVPVVARVVASRTRNASFPDRPLVVGFLDPLQNLAAVRAGTADAIVSNGTGLSSLVALDQAAEYFARKQAPSTENAYADSTGIYGIPLNAPVLVTKDKNLPPAGSYAASKYDVLAFFKAKWAAEFTK